MSKIDKSALAGGLMMGAALVGPAMAETSKLEQLTDPALTEQMIRTSGFQIPDAGEGSIIGIPVGGGNFQIVGRFSVPPEAVDGRAPVAGSTQLMGSNGTCQIFHHDDPAKRLDAGEEYSAALYEPTKVCSYQVKLTDQQITQLANGQARVNQFFAEINVNGAIPAVGGREITDPIQVSTFNLDPAINRELHLNTARAWLACWDATDYSLTADISGFDAPGTSTSQETVKCEDAKSAARSRMGDVRVSVSDAIASDAEASASASRDASDFLTNLLADARRMAGK